MKIQTTKVYNEINQAKESGFTTVSMQGSSRSSKTYNALIWLIVYCLQHPNTRISIVRATLPSIKGSVFIDFKEILMNMLLFDEKCLNKAELTYHFSNGSWVEFFSTDSEQKLRGRKRDILFVNEANELKFIEWQQLKMRTTRFTIIDYNPSFADEHWICETNKDKRTYHFITTYKDNPFLEQVIIDEIESLKSKNNSLWKIYGLGIQAQIEGLIFKNVEIIDEMPQTKQVFIGMDFGFTCFSGDTLIQTIKGQIPIKNIQEGDFVLTRKGYKRVKKVFNNGQKEVVHKKIDLDFGYKEICATFTHNFKTETEWKQYGQLTKGDKLCILQSITENNTSGIQTGNTQTITTLNGKKEGNFITKFFIEKSLKTILAQYQKAKSFIILIATLIITTLIIFALLQSRNMLKFIKSLIKLIKKASIKNKLHIQKKIGTSGEKRQLKECKKHQEFVFNARKIISLQTHIKGFVQNLVINAGKTLRRNSILNLHAKIAIKNLWATNTSDPKLAQQSVHINYHGIREVQTKDIFLTTVYDLEIEDTHEYFANGILVHNCDPTAIAECAITQDTIYVNELCYRTEMISKDIILLLKQKCPDRRIISESADPRLIQEIHNTGINIIPVEKFPGSIEAGITKMLEYRICVTKNSYNIIKELKNYTYQQDKDGKWLNKPIDAFNHAIDAIRYVVLTEVLGKNKKPIDLSRLAKLAH